MVQNLDSDEGSSLLERPPDFHLTPQTFFPFVSGGVVKAG